MGTKRRPKRKNPFIADWLAGRDVGSKDSAWYWQVHTPDGQTRDFRKSRARYRAIAYAKQTGGKLYKVEKPKTKRRNTSGIKGISKMGKATASKIAGDLKKMLSGWLPVKAVKVDRKNGTIQILK